MLERMLSAPVRRVLGVLAYALQRTGMNPNWVTIFGGAMVVLATSLLIGRGHIVFGPPIVALFALCDALDGSLARLGRRTSDWGSFLDSVVDRVVDASVLISIAVWSISVGNHTGAFLAVALVPIGSLVSYTRAKAEAAGLEVRKGFADRTDRLFMQLLLVQLVGFGMSLLMFNIGMLIVALFIGVSVVMRIADIRTALVGLRHDAPGLSSDTPSMS